MNNRLKELYRSVILVHHKEPVGFGSRNDASHQVEAANRMCGDVFRLYFDVAGDQIVRLQFDGHGCAISRAATSVLVNHLNGLSIPNALRVCHEFIEVVRGEDSSIETDNEDFEAFSAAREFPGRQTCALLAWDEMRRFLENAFQTK